MLCRGPPDDALQASKAAALLRLQCFVVTSTMRNRRDRGSNAPRVFDTKENDMTIIIKRRADQPAKMRRERA
jgi:hypothetical protein